MGLAIQDPVPGLHAEEVSVDLAGRRVLSRVGFRTRPGTITALVGPNGSGKSTLLRCLFGAQRVADGRVLLDGEPLGSLPVRTIASRIAVLTQEHPAADGLTVDDVVALGRLPHQRSFGRISATDRTIITSAMDCTGTTALRHRELANLSGGERQRVMLARALAQQPEYLLLDEPTNHLDIRHQLELLHLVKELGVTTVVALHDLNLAGTWCDAVVLLRKGQAIASGRPSDVLTSQRCGNVFEVAVTTLTDAADDQPFLRFSLKGRDV